MFERMSGGGFVNVTHVHPSQDELIVVLRGRVRLLVHNEWRALAPGDAVSVPAGVSHGLENSFADDVLMRVRYTPALPEMSLYFRSLAELSQLGLMTASGIPHPLYCALLFRLSPDLVTFWWFPPTLMWLYAIIVAPIALLLGYSLDRLHSTALHERRTKLRSRSMSPDTPAAAAAASDDNAIEVPTRRRRKGRNNNIVIRNGTDTNNEDDNDDGIDEPSTSWWPSSWQLL